MTSLDKFSESYSSVDDLSTKIRIRNKTKSIKVKVFNMITRIYKTKILRNHISFDCKCKFNSTACNSNEK